MPDACLAHAPRTPTCLRDLRWRPPRPQAPGSPAWQRRGWRPLSGTLRRRRPGLERWSWDLLAVVRRHPWLLTVPLSRMSFGPNRLAWFDRGLRALAETDLPEDEKAAVILLLNGYVFSEARFAAEVADPTRENGVAETAGTPLRNPFRSSSPSSSTSPATGTRSWRRCSSAAAARSTFRPARSTRRCAGWSARDTSAAGGPPSKAAGAAPTVSRAQDVARSQGSGPTGASSPPSSKPSYVRRDRRPN